MGVYKRAPGDPRDCQACRNYRPDHDCAACQRYEETEGRYRECWAGNDRDCVHCYQLNCFHRVAFPVTKQEPDEAIADAYRNGFRNGERIVALRDARLPPARPMVDLEKLLSWAEHHRNRAPSWVGNLKPSVAYHLGQAEKAIALIKAIADRDFGTEGE